MGNGRSGPRGSATNSAEYRRFEKFLAKIGNRGILRVVFRTPNAINRVGSVSSNGNESQPQFPRQKVPLRWHLLASFSALIAGPTTGFRRAHRELPEVDMGSAKVGHSWLPAHVIPGGQPLVWTVRAAAVSALPTVSWGAWFTHAGRYWRSGLPMCFVKNRARRTMGLGEFAVLFRRSPWPSGGAGCWLGSEELRSLSSHSELFRTVVCANA